MIELKYIKKSEYQESLLEEKRREGKEQLISYSDERVSVNLKRYLVVFFGSEVKLIEEV